MSGYRSGFIIVVVLIIATALAAGCSGPGAMPENPGSNDTAGATAMAVPTSTAANSSANASVPINEAQFPMINYEQAVDRVRHFLGNPDATVTIECAVWGTGYSMASDGNYFIVNGLTGDVDYASFLTNPVGNFFSGNVISVEQGKSIAQAFATHYQGFDASDSWHYEGSALHQDDQGGYFYEYEWRKLTGEAKTLNDVIVTVGAGSGKIHTFQGIRVLPGFENNFTTSRQDAARIAASALGNITGESMLSDDAGQWTFDILFRYAFPDQNGNMYGNYTISSIVIHPDLARDKNYLQHIVWRVEMDASPLLANEGVPIPWHYTILVDAGTGEVAGIIHNR